ncbi:uncharacterized protein RCC_01329 [Ramularia collo-cygni]|uniref:Cytochrome P450 n=1 Tax=Ramularia collo-cygni TaxID=112498 RepID=A0A2D3ULT4_9PEZI|nr:uncharacterized protein RCC_01329 [Ramularia collo-cygni]CZT15472.1 uncharacterized protein RCC_01329 [Ramularia collo-cygni]
MDFFNQTYLAAELPPSLAPALFVVSDLLDAPVKLGVTTAITALVSFLAYQAYRPSVDKRSPAFTSDTLPIIGSFGFVTRQWSFWKNAVKESRTGNFSFWQGKRHLIGISGRNARIMLLDHPQLCFISGQSLLAFGLHFWPPIHKAFHGTGERNSSYFLKTLLPLLKTARLERVFKGAMEDASTDFKKLTTTHPNGVINAPTLWRTVFRQNARLFISDDFVHDQALFKKISDHLDVLLHSYSPFYAFLRWIPEPSMIRRRIARQGIRKIIQNLIADRKKNGTKYKDDPLAMMMANGDDEENITEFCTSATFITSTNAHVIFPQLIETMAVHPDWQEKCYREIVAAANIYNKDTSLPLIDRIQSIPMRAWETSFPNLEMCMYEIIRVWTSFAAGRLNISGKAIPIPDSNEVIPPGAFAIWNSTELNFNEELFPTPHKFDPERFKEGRREFEKEPYGFFGWGAGQHPCAGKRWGKLQQTILVAHALALYKWSSCDENGNKDPHAAQRQDLGVELDSEAKFALPAAYCKFEPRQPL